MKLCSGQPRAGLRSNQGHVFLNCPFTQDYERCLDAIAFTLLAVGLQPRCAKEPGRSLYRLKEIWRLMQQAGFSIHDLSRSTARPARYNMPFEFGLWIGIKGLEQRKGQMLILTERPFQHQVELSDALIVDNCRAHGNDALRIVELVLQWTRDYVQTREKKHARLKLTSLKSRFTAYRRKLARMEKDGGRYGFRDRVELMSRWAAEIEKQEWLQ